MTKPQSLSKNFTLWDINLKQTSKAPKLNQADSDLNTHPPPGKFLFLTIWRGLKPHFDETMNAETNTKKKTQTKKPGSKIGKENREIPACLRVLPTAAHHIKVPGVGLQPEVLTQSWGEKNLTQTSRGWQGHKHPPKVGEPRETQRKVPEIQRGWQTLNCTQVEPVLVSTSPHPGDNSQGQ